MRSDSCAGYILAGGSSRRMGIDKALMSRAGRTLTEAIADEVARACGSATLVGHAPIGTLHSIPDLYPGFGPVGGIVTALTDSAAEWNLVVACDMPEVKAANLAELLLRSREAEGDALVPRTAGGQLHPLCAVYRKRALAPLQRAVEEGIHTVREALKRLNTTFFDAGEGSWLANVNTPEEWSASAARQD